MNITDRWPWIEELHALVMETADKDSFDFFHAWWCSLSEYTDKFYFGGY